MSALGKCREVPAWGLWKEIYDKSPRGHGELSASFSTAWKNFRRVFHSMETFSRFFHAMENFYKVFPRYGKLCPHRRKWAEKACFQEVQAVFRGLWGEGVGEEVGPII